METKISEKQSVSIIEKFNELLLERNASMVLMDNDTKTPIAIIPPNSVNGLCPAIIQAIKEEKGYEDIKVSILSVEELDYGYVLLFNIKLDDNGDICQSEYEGHFNCVYIS